MTSGDMDRRVRKTRVRLIHALQDAMLEKGYDAVTVQDILDRADVGRSTFYAHFRDKEDLLVSGHDMLHAEINQQMGAAGHDGPLSVSDIARVVFQHAENNRRTFRAMMTGSSGEIVIRTARGYFEGHVRDDIARSAAAPHPAVVDAVVEFQATALISLISWWLDTESPLTADDMHQLFVTLTQPGVQAVLGEAAGL